MTGQPLTEEELFFIYQKKTAALLSASLEIGALLGGANLEEQEKLASFGEKSAWPSRFGMIFWMRFPAFPSWESLSTLMRSRRKPRLLAFMAWRRRRPWWSSIRKRAEAFYKAWIRALWMRKPWSFCFPLANIFVPEGARRIFL